MSDPDYKRETLQTAEERAGETVPRTVADRLAEACEQSLDILTGGYPSDADHKEAPYYFLHAALADYRKAVSGG